MELKMHLVVGGQTYATYETEEEYDHGHNNRLNIGTDLLRKSFGSCLPMEITLEVKEPCARTASRKHTGSQKTP